MRMKVLVISNMYPGKGSYFGIFVKSQIEALKADGVRIIKVVRTKKTTFATFSFMLRSIFYLLFKSYDVVHSHYGFHSALMAAIIRKKPLIITYHGSDAKLEPFRNKLYFFFQKFTINHADHLIAVSNDIRNTLINKLHANPDKISVISCGVDTSKFRPFNKIEARKKLGIPLGKKIVLFVGRIELMKGVDLLYECAQTMPEILFILIGEGQFRPEVENCKFVGGRPHDEMPTWMNAADVFVLPSRSEGTPVVLLEALSCGVPVISSDVGGCPDLIKEGQTGYLVPVGNAGMLQERMRMLIDNSAERVIVGYQGRKNVVEKYDNQIIAQKIKSIYSEVQK